MTFLPKPERGQVVSRSRACLAAKDTSLCLRAASAARHPVSTSGSAINVVVPSDLLVAAGAAASSLRLRVLNEFANPKTDYRKPKCKGRKYYNRDFELAGRVGIRGHAVLDVGNWIHGGSNRCRISHG
jgi:hypothetical protein